MLIRKEAVSTGNPRELVKKSGWAVQEALGEGEAEYGKVGERRGPDLPPSYSEENKVEFPAHPLLAQSVQHSGINPSENPNAAENPDTKDELLAELQNQLQNQPQLVNKLGLSMAQRIQAYNNEKKYQNTFTNTAIPRPAGF